mmetsp:Transcript_14382/g.24493  ORF Transcript_14382/g.24493 Transcript_14382/m.24493 type:complete len:218 (+) Transcript_14382:1380-2033(+)
MSLPARKVTWRTKWSDFVKEFQGEAAYLDLLGQSYAQIGDFMPKHHEQQSSFRSSAHQLSVQLRYLAQQGSSTPHEIFCELVDLEKEALKTLKPKLKQLFKGNSIRFQDSSFSAFDQALSPFEAYQALTELERTLLFEYYSDKVQQKEKEKKEEMQALKSEIEHLLSKQIDLGKSKSAGDYLGLFEKVVGELDPKVSPTLFSADEQLKIIDNSIQYL